MALRPRARCDALAVHLAPWMRHKIDIQPQVHVHHCTIFGFQATRNPPRCADDGKQTNQQRFQHQTVYCLLCGTATLTHTHTYLWIFSKAAILCFTDHNARGDDEGGRAFNFEKQKSTRSRATNSLSIHSLHLQVVGPSIVVCRFLQLLRG